MSCAKIGSSAVADEKNVAKKSSSIVERMMGSAKTKPRPSRMAPRLISLAWRASRAGTSRIISNAAMTQTNVSGVHGVDPAHAERGDHDAAD